MGALTKARVSSVREVTRDLRPLAAGAKVFKGGLAIAIVSSTSAGYYQQGVSTVTGVAVGRFAEDVDNTAGADGALSATVDFFRERHLFLLNNDALGSLVLVGDRESQCYVLDDQTVTHTIKSVSAGIVYDVTTEGVWVEVDASPSAAELAPGISAVAPVDPSVSAASAGIATLAAAQDHLHHIALSTVSANGLMSAADKVTSGNVHKARGVAPTNVANLAAFVVAGFDGVTYVAGDRVLLAGQTTKSQNGIYVVGTVAGTAPLTLATDWATGQADGGCIILISEGTLFANTTWKNMTAGVNTVATTNIDIFPQMVTKGVTLVAGTATAITTIPVWNAGTTMIDFIRTVPNTCTLTTGGYQVVPIATAGKSGASSIVPMATVAAGTINVADISTLIMRVQNW